MSGTNQKLVRGKLYFRGEVLNNVLNGKVPPRGPTLLKKPFMTEKGSPFVYLLLTNGTPFTYLLWNFTSLLPGVKCGCLTFKYEKITKPQRFLDFFTAIKRVSLLGLFTNRNDRFPYPFHILQLVKWSPFHIPEA